VHVYETDLMGIVHHSNYLRFCEEARVDWCKKKGLLSSDSDTVYSLSVLETKVKHIRPAKFSDLIQILIQAKVIGARLVFQYKLFVADKIVCIAETVHCNLVLDLDKKLKVKRLNIKLMKTLENEIWTETWL